MTMKVLKRRVVASGRHRVAPQSSARSHSVLGGGGGMPLHQAPQQRRQRGASGLSVFASARSGLLADDSSAAGFPLPGLVPGLNLGGRPGLNRFGEAVSLLGRAAGAQNRNASYSCDGGGGGGLEVSQLLREGTSSISGRRRL